MIFSGGEGAQTHHHRQWVIWLTLLFGVMMDSFNWRDPWSAAIPDISPLILLYWVLAIAQRNFIITAIFIGIIHDVLYHTSLGSHALIYLGLLYPILYVRLQLRNTTLFQMSLIVGLWMLAHQALSWILHLGRIGSEQQLSFWLASLVAMFLWPLVFISLRMLRRHMRVR